MSVQVNGLQTWLLQRLSAVYIAAFLVVALLWLWLGDTVSYEQWLTLVAHPVVNIAINLFMASTLIHAWVGMRDVLIDYVPVAGLRFTLLTLLALFLITMGVWTLMILLSVVQI